MPQRTVLISEDSPTTLLAMRRTAEANGMHVIPDRTSNAYELAKHHHPDVVVLDLNQQVRAPELLRRLKEDPETRAIPVIVLTAGRHAQDRNLCAHLGAEYFELKPVQADFWTRLTQLVDVHASEAELLELA